RFVGSARASHRHQIAAGRYAHGQRPRTPVGARRLCGAVEGDDRGPRGMVDGAIALRSGTAESAAATGDGLRQTPAARGRVAARAANRQSNARAKRMGVERARVAPAAETPRYL